MRPVLRDAEGDDAATALKLSYDALDLGQISDARQLAQSVLLAARASSDLTFEANALACLAHCDRAAARLQRASDTSRKAVQIFERLGDTIGETRALTTLAHVSMLLGRSDDALEAALLCVRLCEREPNPQAAAVFAHNCLGIVYGYSGNFEAAKRALQRAIKTARDCTPALSTFEPRINLAWVEATRLVDERFETGHMHDVESFDALVRAFKEAERSPDGIGIAPVLTPPDGVLSTVLDGLAACWGGHAECAQTRHEMAVRSLSGTPTWLDALVQWLAAELAWAAGNWTSTELALLRMKDLAVAAQHEHLACLAHLMRAQAFELQGKHAAAQLEHRLLRARERTSAALSLASREAGVGWRLNARRSEHHLEQALIASKKFERWSLEDALTGIANRRCFEATLAKALEEVTVSGSPVTVAMIDVDRFKSINDTYSHQVGDQVLTALASLLVGSVRNHDVAARLAGDEFVVLFEDAGIELAQQICDRIQSAVADFDWSAIAAGLSLSISIGLETAVVGDTVETVLRRSDRSMYSVKPGWVPTNL